MSVDQTQTMQDSGNLAEYVLDLIKKDEDARRGIFLPIEQAILLRQGEIRKQYDPKTPINPRELFKMEIHLDRSLRAAIQALENIDFYSLSVNMVFQTGQPIVVNDTSEMASEVFTAMAADILKLKGQSKPVRTVAKSQGWLARMRGALSRRRG
ncbi:MAG: hypothetical protein AB7G80_05695 [Dongiaceae bacterium]